MENISKDKQMDLETQTGVNVSCQICIKKILKSTILLNEIIVNMY